MGKHRIKLKRAKLVQLFQFLGSPQNRGKLEGFICNKNRDLIEGITTVSGGANYEVQNSWGYIPEEAKMYGLRMPFLDN